MTKRSRTERRSRRSARKLPPSKKRKPSAKRKPAYVCPASQDTGINSRGGVCIACQVRHWNEEH